MQTTHKDLKIVYNPFQLTRTYILNLKKNL